MRTAIRRSLPLLAAVVSAALPILSCGPTFSFEGTWIGNRNLHAPGVDPYTAYTAGRVTLSITGNHFEATEAGVPISGTVSYGGRQATLRVDQYMKMPLDRTPIKFSDIRLTGQSDGRILYDDRRVSNTPVALERTASKDK